MALSIRLHGTEEDIREFLDSIQFAVKGVEEMSMVSDLHGNGKMFQFAKWENPNVPGQPS